MPQEAFTVAHEFRERHGNDLTPSLINQLLGDLNRIWRERERKQISRIKLQCSQEINQLKRQLINRAPFDEVTAKKNIARLQRQLDEARSQLKNGGGSASLNTSNSSKTTPLGVELIDNTLQIITSMQ